MFWSAVEQIREVVRTLEPARLSGADAARLVEGFSELERLAAAGKALAAARATETNQWRRDGDRSAEHWLARKSGSTVGAAKDALETAKRLDQLPATAEAVRQGKLSAKQATLVTKGASADPDAEQQLLDAAPHESVRELERRAERVIAAKRSAEDERAREDAIRKSRSARTMNTDDGAAELRVRGTRTDIATMWSHLQPWIDEQFDLARKEGRREQPDAYAFDGLMKLMTTATSGGKSVSPAKVLVRVDFSAVRRGTTVPGEVCEIDGFGPIPVSEVLRLIPEAFLALVLTRGKRVINVTHLGRQFTEVQKTALEWESPDCDVLGCSCTARLERDHRADWAKTKRTTVDLADRLCHFHHRLKTLHGYQLETGTGKRRFLPLERAPALAS